MSFRLTRIVSHERRILPIYAGCGQGKDPKVSSSIENKAVVNVVGETMVTSDFGEANANIRHGCVIHDQTKFDTKRRGKIEMRKQKGFSLIELLIVVAIILIIAAIAIPNLLRARMAANESSAVASVRTINTGMITYNSTYPTVGFAGSLAVLGGVAPCTPSSTTACLIDSVLAAGTKSGYTFAATGAGGPPAITYYATAVPVTLNQTGIRSFCSFEDAVVRVQPTGAAIASEAACQALTPLNQ